MNRSEVFWKGVLDMKTIGTGSGRRVRKLSTVRMLGIKEVSFLLGIRPQTIRNQLSSGTFPIPTKKIGRLLKWDSRDIHKYLDNLSKIN